MSLHYVISDLHLGMGRKRDGTWHTLEDFKSHESFKKFLDTMEDDEVDELIINGDWIDFTQLEPMDYRRGLYSAEGHNLGWTEAESVKMLEKCKAATAHKSFFDDLRAFLHNTKKKLTIIMGNHDPDLFWPKVEAEIRALLCPSNNDQVEMVMTHVRRGTAHIEHGHQHCSPENKFYNPENVFHTDADGIQRIELVWGSIFVMEFFNPIEKELPFANNLKTQARAIYLGIKNGWVGGGMAAEFVKFLWCAGIPWQAISANVLSKQQPKEMIMNLKDPELAQTIIKVYENNPAFREDFRRAISNTTKTEWDAMNAIDKKGHRRQQPVSVDEFTPAIGPKEAATLGVFRKNPEIRGARSLMSDDVKYVIFGHTHTEIDGSHPASQLPNYFNTGSWVNSMDLSTPENRLLLKNISREDLKNEDLFDLRLRAAVVEVTNDKGTNVSLREIEV